MPSKEYYALHAERYRSARKEKYAQDPEKERAASAEWRERNPEKLAAASQKQRERRLANPEHFRELERKAAANLRRKIDMLKVERGCYDCGVRGLPAIAYDWDHIPGKEKRFNIGAQMKSFGLDSVLAEIEKCQCVCATCHRLRTESRKMKGES